MTDGFHFFGLYKTNNANKFTRVCKLFQLYDIICTKNHLFCHFANQFLENVKTADEKICVSEENAGFKICACTLSQQEVKTKAVAVFNRYEMNF